MKALLAQGFGRDDKIRTCDPYVPNVVRYRAALHPVLFSYKIKDLLFPNKINTQPGLAGNKYFSIIISQPRSNIFC